MSPKTRTTQSRFASVCLAFALGLLPPLVSIQSAASETSGRQLESTGTTGKPPYNIIFIIVGQQTGYFQHPVTLSAMFPNRQPQ